LCGDDGKEKGTRAAADSEFFVPPNHNILSFVFCFARSITHKDNKTSGQSKRKKQNIGREVGGLEPPGLFHVLLPSPFLSIVGWLLGKEGQEEGKRGKGPYSL